VAECPSLSATTLSSFVSGCSNLQVNQRLARRKLLLWTEKSAKSYDWPSEKCARSHECFAPKIQSGMLRNIRGQQDAQMSRAVSIAFEAPLVASPNQAMRAIQVSRKKLYELSTQENWKAILKANRDASRSNQSTTTSSADWQQRRFGAAALHLTEMINHVRKRDSRLATQPAGVAIKKVIYLPHLTSSH
jgi:hypothetical protein